MNTDSFLENIAQHLNNCLGDNLNNYILVFPNQRAGLFFQTHLAKIRKKTFLAPTTTTVNNIFDLLSDQGINTDRINLLISLFNVYREVLNNDTRLDDFLFWGQMMLSDFNEVDEHLIDVKRLFVETSNIKELDSMFVPNLSDQQKEAIRALMGGEISEERVHEQHFRNIWQHLATIHDRFAEQLLNNGTGLYRGLQHRRVIEQLKKSPTLWNKTFGDKQLIFIGFNALTGAEEALFNFAKDNGGDFYWDYSSDDLRQLSGELYKHNTDLFPSLHHFSPQHEPRITDYNINKQLQLYGIASNIGQAKVANHILKQIIAQNNELQRTAIVLADEQLLLPLLNSLDKDIKHINVTMGLPLASTPAFSLLNYLCQMQLKRREKNGVSQFYHKDIEAIISHSYTIDWFERNNVELSLDAISRDMLTNRRIYSSAENLGDSQLFRLIFQSVDKNNLIDYLIEVFDFLHQSDSDEESEHFTQKQIYLAQYLDMLQRLKHSFAGNIPLEMSGLVRLIRQLSATETVSFRGEPLRGLQVMGNLEARSLDFDNLIILSANEGTFPHSATKNSYIPYIVRKAYQLPTHELSDNIDSYNFYRMLLHANNVFFVYDTRPDGNHKGEVSRYVMQLRYKHNVAIKEYMVETEAQMVPTYQQQQNSETLSIAKSDTLLEKLNKMLHSQSGISASMIKDYLTCTLKFYFNRIEHIHEEQTLDDNIQSNEFGNIVHKALENIYNTISERKDNNLITAQLIQDLIDDKPRFEQFCEEAFRSEYMRAGGEIEGEDTIILRVVRQYVRQVLERDIEYTPFYYVGAEYEFQGKLLTLSSGQDITLNGKIDRIDLKHIDGKWIMRIIDYKTGKEHNKLSAIENAFRRDKNDHQNDMQALMYCMVMKQLLPTIKIHNDIKYTDIHPELKTESIIIEPHLFYTRLSSSAETFQTNILLGDKSHSTPIQWTKEINDEFEALLREVFEEMLSPEIDFEQTTSKDQCNYCPFGDICHRDTEPKYK